MFSPILRPLPSVRNTWWLSLAQSTPAHHRSSLMLSPRFKLRAAATSADPCTGARKARHGAGADSPRGIDYGQSGKARVPPQVIESQGAIGCSRQTGSVWEGYADLGRRPLAALRSATLHCARPAAGPFYKTPEKGTGGGRQDDLIWSGLRAPRQPDAPQTAPLSQLSGASTF